ncbi:MAG TPA: peptidase M10 [Chitinophagaceae bacterium]|nr:peptidase M10 [Chitinophagaceae bacterium]
MGEAELDYKGNELIITSHLITYGQAADPEITAHIREETEAMWNEPGTSVELDGQLFRVLFRITAAFHPKLEELEVLQSTDPRRNYFRIEEQVQGNISFVDGLGCNTGFFQRNNLYPGSTTAAHEYGHTLGLDHPENLDYRGQGVPGIMYPRGTLVDPPYQYDPAKPAGETGGTLNPVHRRVKDSDIRQLKLHRLFFRSRRAVVGAFTNVFHWTGDDV